MGDFVNPSNAASKSPHNDGGQKVCIVFKLLSFYEMVTDWTLSGVQCTKYNGRSMVRRMLKAPQLVNMPCNNIPGTFGECVMGGGGFDSKRVQAPEIGQKRQAL